MNLRSEMGLAKDLFGTPPSPNAKATTATAITDSSNGKVEIQYDGDTETMEVDCIGSVRQGEEVDVIVRDGGSTYVTGAKGWGDRMQSDVDAATTKTAYITHVETGSDAGLHVHEVKEGEQTPGAEPYDEGSDLWLNPSSVILRENGQKTASFSRQLVELGCGANDAVIDLCDGAGRMEEHNDDGRGLGLLSDENIYVQAHKRDDNADKDAFASMYVSNDISIPKGMILLNVGEYDGSVPVGREDYINIQSGSIWVDHYASTGGSQRLGHSGRIPIGVLDSDVVWADPRVGGNLFVMCDWPIFHDTATVGNATWEYTIYASGKVECWGKTSNITAGSFQTWGSMYFAGPLGTANYPTGLFSSVSYATAEWVNVGSDAWSGQVRGTGSTTAPPKVYAYRATNASSHTGYIQYYARGSVGSISY